MSLWNWKCTASVGALFWGAWAFAVNWDAGLVWAVPSALAQAAVSFGSISLLTLLADRVLAGPWPNRTLRPAPPTPRSTSSETSRPEHWPGGCH